MQQVPVAGIGFFLSNRYRDAVGLGVGHALGPARQVPLPPGHDNFQVRGQGLVGELEAHLVVAFAGGAVAHGVGAGLFGHLHLGLGDQGPGDGGAQEIRPLIEGVGPEHGPDEVPDELFLQVLDKDLVGAGGPGLGGHLRQFVALAQVGGKGHHRALILLLEPLENHRGVQAAGVGQDDFFDVRHILFP